MEGYIMRVSKLALTLSLGTAALLFSSCATIINGQTQKIHVKTKPPTAKLNIEVDGMKAVAPTIIEVKRENKNKLIKVEDCPGEEVLLSKKLDPITFLNIISGGGIGLTTDYLSGAMWKYEPEEVTVEACPAK